MATNDDVARIILSVLCRYNCQTSLKQLLGQLTRDGLRIINYTNLLKFLEKYQNIFCIQPERKTADSTVYIHAPVPLCEDHCTKNGQCQQGFNCSSLHVCKFFLLSDCGRPSCAYGHSLHTQHNMNVLQEFLMDRLMEPEIKIILKQMKNRTFLTKPEICRFFNIAKGCNKERCPFLHLCNHFIHNTCKFGRNCKRSHNIGDPDVLNNLNRYGISTERPESHILADLRMLFDSSSTSLPRYGSVSSLDGVAQASPTRGNRSRSTDSRQRNRIRRSSSPGASQDRMFPQAAPQPMSSYGRPLSPGYAQNLEPQQQYPQAMAFQGARPKVMSPGGTNPNQGQDQSKKLAYGKQLSETSDKDSQEICLYKVKGKCWYGQQCIRHHKDAIYQWQYLLDREQEWRDFDEDTNINIETNYCQPEKNECFEKILGEVVQIRFGKSMTGSGKTVNMAIRRLSTVSSEATGVVPVMAQWTTEWRWFWKGPDGNWIMYGEKDSTGLKSNFDSETIEAKYLEDTKGGIEFETGQFTYRLNFDTMMQENTKLLSRTQREVRRRPQFFKVEDLKNRSSKSQSNTEAVPKEWSEQKFKTPKALLGHYEEIKVERTSEEFQQVKELFEKTLPGDKITSITRIENGELWTSFSIKRNQMTTKAGKTVKELSLFHGTDEETILPICHQGFDFRFSGSKVGALLGKGSYFARDAKYSSSYVSPAAFDKTGLAKMFVARVLVGDYAVGNPNYVRPPQKSVNNQFELYDSCVNKTSDPSIYVVFSLEQTYPEYLITFRR